ncbi:MULTISPECIES: glutathione peroxidase [Halomonas]|uniref:glutathione peroxidase n=1 Tax=Halomonas TaxID=2745 RepID=UPI001A8DE46B|nr:MULTISPECIES: glutathione peroxidase [Halomonas]MED5296473.1 glutathione peroxidase [Pseudomonadota bacterium]MBN8412448.1 glutathione peroxidase [Halomonas litopenaei]MBY5924735.1 glutathione peroxidase [Halomonas sp. DP4Y7-2]MBY5929541.1 glutathione peroxidase [Halomonas sp. DP8Y7-3]MBY5968684.1 glutathione peroxidase [Halomonas denitrificans]
MSLHDVECHTHQGEPFNLRALRGQVLLVVNVASQCGFTSQLGELEALYREHRERGFTVLGFPCNQFAKQSPESAEQFCAFGERQFGVTFPLMEKVEVNGRGAHPLFQRLKAEAPGWLGTRAIKWNFTKFLVARDGRVLKRFGPRDGAAAMLTDLERALDET